MAIISRDTGGLFMINVVLVGGDVEIENQQLSIHTDMKVTVIAPSTLEETLAQAEPMQADIFILKHAEKDIDAAMLCHFLSKHCPKAQSLFVTDEIPTFEMLQSTGFKARGYITKEQQNKLADAVRVIHDGEAWLPRTLVAEMLNHFATEFYSSDMV
jgi:DNA-binding NarL/FixJ family response regulator